MSTEIMNEAIEQWNEETNRRSRVTYLWDIAKQAGIFDEFAEIHPIRIKNMDYKEYMITLQGLAKIKEMKRIADGNAQVISMWKARE